MDVVYETAHTLLNEMWKNEPIRLVGLGLDDLTYNLSYQASLFDKEEDFEHNENLDAAVDKIKDKYGRNVIKKASLIGKKEVRKKY